MAGKDGFIGVFDSGVGGISVLKELMKLMPQEDFVYFGDSANAPYGKKITEEVRELTLRHGNMLFDRGAKAIVVACNTATSAAIDLLRQAFPDKPVLGIEPALKPAITQFPTGSIGIMATEVTLREEKLQKLMAQFDTATVHRISAPGLVELIESGRSESEETRRFLEQLLAPYVGKLDALVLGCTHYPFASRAISRVLGNQTVLLEGGGELAGSALRAGVVDYVEFHIAPKLLGGTGRPVVGGLGPELMKQAQMLNNVEIKQYGDDIAVCGYLKA